MHFKFTQVVYQTPQIMYFPFYSKLGLSGLTHNHHMHPPPVTYPLPKWGMPGSPPVHSCCEEHLGMPPVGLGVTCSEIYIKERGCWVTGTCCHHCSKS